MGKDFIAKAIKKPGALRKTLKIKKGKDIPAAKLKKAAKGIGVSKKTAIRARLAVTLKKLSKLKKK
jgi:hypothetical protein